MNMKRDFKNKEKGVVIINRNTTYGTLNGVIEKNEKLRSLIFKSLKQGKAKLIIDNEETLMYNLI
jgi:hypothetical protein